MSGEPEGAEGGGLPGTRMTKARHWKGPNSRPWIERCRIAGNSTHCRMFGDGVFGADGFTLLIRHDRVSCSCD